MKKILLLIILFTTVSSVSYAQSSSSISSSSTLTAGVGFGTPYFGSGYSSSLPVNPTITYEHAVADGISAGGTISYASTKYDFGDGYDIKESAVYIGARGSYHLNGLVDLGKNIDLYGGASIGYVIVNVSDNIGDSYTGTTNGFGYGVFAGGKYYFQSNVGIYTELGYASLSYLNVGISFKF